MRITSRCLWGAVLMLVIPAVSGCGYALAGRGSFLPTYIKTVAIPPFENRTPYQTAEQITQKVREEFIGRGKFKVVDPAGADALLRGEVIGFSLVPAGLNPQQLANRYRFIVIIKVSFIDNRTNEVLWSNDALTFQEEYDLVLTGPIDTGTFVDQQKPAIDRMATDVARTVVTAIVEAF